MGVMVEQQQWIVDNMLETARILAEIQARNANLTERVDHLESQRETDLRDAANRTPAHRANIIMLSTLVISTLVSVASMLVNVLATVRH